MNRARISASASRRDFRRFESKRSLTSQSSCCGYRLPTQQHHHHADQPSDKRDDPDANHRRRRSSRKRDQRCEPADDQSWNERQPAKPVRYAGYPDDRDAKGQLGEAETEEVSDVPERVDGGIDRAAQCLNRRPRDVGCGAVRVRNARDGDERARRAAPRRSSRRKTSPRRTAPASPRSSARDRCRGRREWRTPVTAGSTSAAANVSWHLPTDVAHCRCRMRVVARGRGCCR